MESAKSFDKVASRGDFIEEIKKIYDVVAVFSSKNGKTVMRMRNKNTGRDVVVRSYDCDIPVYDYLSGVVCEGLPKVYDTYKFNDGAVVIEEYISGIRLSEDLENGLYDYKAARKVMLSLCLALSVMHSNGFVHRDVKPENVIIRDDGGCALIDFDASRSFKPERSRDTSFLGTVGFASPEQFGIAQSDERSDIYALGVLFNIMLTGAHPSEKLADGKAGKIVLRCTQINPEKRYSGVTDLARQL